MKAIANWITQPLGQSITAGAIVIFALLATGNYDWRIVIPAVLACVMTAYMASRN